MDPWLHAFFKELPEYLSYCMGLGTGQANSLAKRLYKERRFLEAIGEICTDIYLKILIGIEVMESPHYYHVNIHLVSRVNESICSTHDIFAVESENLRERMLWIAELVDASLQVMGGFSSVVAEISPVSKSEIRAIHAFQRLAERGLDTIFRGAEEGDAEV